MPRVAVLLPARDAERTVRAAVVSILRQTWRDLGLVAVDDGSRDQTGCILESLANRDRRVHLVRGPGEGIAGALSRGLALCDSEVVVRMDADDVAHPQRIERQVAALQANRALVAIGSRVRLFPRHQVGQGMRRYVEWLNGLITPELVDRDLFVESPLAHPAAAIRAEALHNAGGWRQGPFPEDYELWLRLAVRGGKITNLAETLLDWRESRSRLTRTDPRYGLERHRQLKAHYLAIGPLAGRRKVALWGAGETGRAFARALRSVAIQVTCFVEVDRRKIGRRLGGAPIISYEQVESLRGTPVLVAVGAPGARDLIRAELRKRGFQEPSQFRCIS